jgi:hypothetical protein
MKVYLGILGECDTPSADMAALIVDFERPDGAKLVQYVAEGRVFINPKFRSPYTYVDTTTALNLFGIQAILDPDDSNRILFIRRGVSFAKYRDGMPRRWQDTAMQKDGDRRSVKIHESAKQVVLTFFGERLL